MTMIDITWRYDSIDYDKGYKYLCIKLFYGLTV